MCRSRVRPGLGTYERRMSMDKHLKVIAWFAGVDFRKKEFMDSFLAGNLRFRTERRS